MSNKVSFAWDKGQLSKLKLRAMQNILIMAYDLAAEARSGSPGAPVASGDLKASIRVEEKKGAVEVIAGGKFNGADIKYALRQEYENPNGHQGYLRQPFERMFSTDAWKDKYFGKAVA